MEAIVNNLIKAIGWSIVHSLWQGAVIYAVLFAILMIRPKMSARLKHNLSFGALFLIFASFCFTFSSVFEWPSKAQVAVKSIELNQLAYQDLLKLGNSFSLKTEAYFPVIAMVYLVGIIFQLLILSSGYLKLKKLKQAGTLAVPADWKAVFELTVAQLKLNKRVNFYLSPKVNVPLVIGFLKPVVLFPVALATQLDLKQVEAILIHELSHIRRNDYLINLVKTCIETLLFFNPFVWLTTRFIHIEREHACDDLVVNFTGTPLTYAHALLKLELLKEKQVPALSLAATGKNQHLYQRIKRITDMKTNYINAKQQFFILTMAIATVVSLAWINPSKKTAAKAKKEKPTFTINLAPVTAKSLTHKLICKADTDSTKKKNKYKIIITDDKGNQQVFNSLRDLPDSLQIRISDLDSATAKRMEYFKSPEWKLKVADIEKHAAELNKKFQSKEWKDNMARIQERSEEMTRKFNSPEWKAQMEKVQKNAEEVAKKFESKEWKDQMAKVQEQSLAMAKKFESKEWKDHMAKIQEKSEEMTKKFNSPEWRKHMERIEKNAEEIGKKFDSPEWKQKMEDLKKLQDSPEYKELRKKYENDLEELKKKKGIKSDKAFLLFDTNNIVGKMFLPATESFKAFAAIDAIKMVPEVSIKYSPEPAAEINLKDITPQIIFKTAPLKN